MQEAVNIREYLDIFKRRKWIIIILVFASLVFGGYKTYKNYISYVPTYTSTVTVRINTMKEYEEQQAKQKEKQKSKKKDSSNTNNLTDSTNSTNLYNSYSSTAEMRNQNIASSYLGITKKEQFRIVLLVECLDTRIKTPNDVAKYWNLPLIGVISMDYGKTKGVYEVKNRGE